MKTKTYIGFKKIQQSMAGDMALLYRDTLLENQSKDDLQSQGYEINLIDLRGGE